MDRETFNINHGERTGGELSMHSTAGDESNAGTGFNAAKDGFRGIELNNDLVIALGISGCFMCGFVDFKSG